MGLLVRPAWWTSSLYLKPWPVCTFKDWPFRLYVVAASKSNEGSVLLEVLIHFGHQNVIIIKSDWFFFCLMLLFYSKNTTLQGETVKYKVTFTNQTFKLKFVVMTSYIHIICLKTNIHNVWIYEDISESLDVVLVSTCYQLGSVSTYSQHPTLGKSQFWLSTNFPVSILLSLDI